MSCIPNDAWDDVSKIYEELEFCFETRLQLPDFIETNFGDGNVDDATAANWASQLLIEIEAHIDSISKSSQMLTIKRTLQQTLNILKRNDSKNGLIQLYKKVANCLERERNILYQYNNVLASKKPDDLDEPDIQTDIDNLKENGNKLRSELEKIQRQYEENKKEDGCTDRISLKYEQKKIQMSESSLEVQRIKKTYDNKKKALEIRNKNFTIELKRLEQKFEDMFEKYKAVKDIVLDREVKPWTEELKQNAARELFIDSEEEKKEKRKIELEKLRVMCENLAEIIWTMLKSVIQLCILAQNDIKQKVDSLLLKIKTCIQDLVKGGFIIEKQPPQVLRTNVTRFSPKLKFLPGSLLMEGQNPMVNVDIVRGENVNGILNSKEMKNKFSCGVIDNVGRKKLMYDSEESSFEFQDLVLKRIERERRRNDFVAVEIYSLIFSMEFTVQNDKFQLCIASVPLAVIAHPSQLLKAKAGIIWANAGKSYLLENHLPWFQIADSLSSIWYKTCGKPFTQAEVDKRPLFYEEACARPLSNEDTYYLACRAFGDRELDCNIFNEKYLSWAQFSKDEMHGQEFTFWEWFYNLLTLTHEHLKLLWLPGYLMGFVEKQQAVELLSQQPQGTFMLRFSDSVSGGVTIAYQNGEPAYPNVEFVEPFTKDDLAKRSLFNGILDLNYLTQLYLHSGTNIEKIYFTNFLKNPVTPQRTTKTGYIPKPQFVFGSERGSSQGSSSPPPGNNSPTNCPAICPSPATIPSNPPQSNGNSYGLPSSYIKDNNCPPTIIGDWMGSSQDSSSPLMGNNSATNCQSPTTIPPNPPQSNGNGYGLAPPYSNCPPTTFDDWFSNGRNVEGKGFPAENVSMAEFLKILELETGDTGNTFAHDATLGTTMEHDAAQGYTLAHDAILANTMEHDV